jgi:acyl-coenzyme A thioesterase PaaI-like protein
MNCPDRTPANHPDPAPDQGSQGGYFQDAMPGEICFGCGADNALGLRIKSYWAEGVAGGEAGEVVREGAGGKDEAGVALCRFQPEPHHQGWPGLVCGGILATLIDCHCMATAMAHAIRREGRPLHSEPHYRFATGSLNIRYLKPTPADRMLTARAAVTEVQGKKSTLHCEIWAGEVQTVVAEVVAFLVYRSDHPSEGGLFQGESRASGGSLPA